MDRPRQCYEQPYGRWGLRLHAFFTYPPAPYRWPLRSWRRGAWRRR